MLFLRQIFLAALFEWRRLKTVSDIGMNDLARIKCPFSVIVFLGADFTSYFTYRTEREKPSH